MRKSRNAASGTMSPRFGRMSEFAGLMVGLCRPLVCTACQYAAIFLDTAFGYTDAVRALSGTGNCLGYHDTGMGLWMLTRYNVQAGPASLDSQDSMYFDAEDELPASPSSSDGEAHGNDFVAAFSASLQRLTSKNRSSMNDRVRLRVRRRLTGQLSGSERTYMVSSDVLACYARAAQLC